MTAIVLAGEARDPSRFTALRRAAAATTARHPFFWGVVLMVLTTSLWGLTFLPPIAIPDATATEVAFGRFLVYGLISSLTLDLGRLLRLPAGILVRALLFALAGNVVYYVVLMVGMRLAGATMGVLIIGLLPVTVSVVGQLHADARALKGLAVPFLLFGAGVIFFNAARTDFFRDVSHLSFVGLLCITASLAMWTWYAIANARFLKATTVVSAKEWSSIIGILSLIVSLAGLPVSWSLGLARDPSTLSVPDLSQLALWSVLLGAGTTWLGTVLFNMASKLLEVSVLGQLIVFDVIFGTIYVLMVMDTAPSIFELAGLAVALFAIWLSVHRLQRLGQP
ncbi:MAG: DMT family transporter [Alphaproteobacteria bacterium]